MDAVEGGDSLMEACKPALESTIVTKVVHDCKRDSEVWLVFKILFVLGDEFFDVYHSLFLA